MEISGASAAKQLAHVREQRKQIPGSDDGTLLNDKYATKTDVAEIVAKAINQLMKSIGTVAMGSGAKPDDDRPKTVIGSMVRGGGGITAADLIGPVHPAAAAMMDANANDVANLASLAYDQDAADTTEAYASRRGGRAFLTTALDRHGDGIGSTSLSSMMPPPPAKPRKEGKQKNADKAKKEKDNEKDAKKDSEKKEKDEDPALKARLKYLRKGSVCDSVRWLAAYTTHLSSGGAKTLEFEKHKLYHDFITSCKAFEDESSNSGNCTRAMLDLVDTHGHCFAQLKALGLEENQVEAFTLTSHRVPIVSGSLS